MIKSGKPWAPQSGLLGGWKPSLLLVILIIPIVTSCLAHESPKRAHQGRGYGPRGRTVTAETEKDGRMAPSEQWEVPVPEDGGQQG